MPRNIIPIYSLVGLLLMCFYLVLGNSEVQCTDVIMELIPCQGFLMNGEESPTAECCSGAQALDKQFAASEKADRQAQCSCLKDTAKSFPIDVQKAAKLPALCNLAVKIPMDPNVDCST